MKILQVITSLHTGGAEKLIVDIAPLLIERGHQVEVVLFNGEETPFKKMLLERGVKLHNFSIGGLVYNPLHCLKLRRFFKDFDIIHTHNTSPQFFVAFARLISGGKARCVTTEHNTHNRRRDIALFKSLDKFVYRQYESIICISEKAHINLASYLGSQERICTICNGIPLDAFKKEEAQSKLAAFGLAETDFVLAQVAGFRQQKDQDCVIRALQHLPAHVHAVFVGDGERRAECEELAKHLGLDSRCHFLGIRTDIPQLLKSADIAVSSSHWEGLPLSTVEGMAAGKPVLASDVDGLKGLVEGAGLLFEASNDKALAKLVTRLMEDESFYQETVQKCFARAQKYDIHTMVDAYEAEYKRVLQQDKL